MTIPTTHCQHKNWSRCPWSRGPSTGVDIKSNLMFGCLLNFRLKFPLLNGHLDWFQLDLVSCLNLGSICCTCCYILGFCEVPFSYPQSLPGSCWVHHQTVCPPGVGRLRLWLFSGNLPAMYTAVMSSCVLQLKTWPLLKWRNPGWCPLWTAWSSVVCWHLSSDSDCLESAEALF